MGKKKPKEPETTNSTRTQNDVDSAPPTSSVFKSLFGDVQGKKDAVSSLFSDNNPFKRKPQQSAATPVNDAVNGGSGVAELKKRKNNKENREKSNLDDPGSFHEEEATGTPLVNKKKSKKLLETGNSNMGFEDKSNGGLETEKPKNPDLDFEEKLNLGNELSPASKKDKKMESISDSDAKNMLNKKKRKRDDVEKEYEERRYGGKDAANEEEEPEQEKGNVVGKKRKKADDAADTLVPKEGFDDESKLLRTAFVGNLPVKVKKKLLLKEFSKFGEIESVRIRSVPLMDTKKPTKGAVIQKQINENADSVHAYIVFKTEQSAEASLSHNMAVVGGNHIRVDRACPPRKKLKGDNTPLYDNKRTVFVGNLPYDVKDEELYQLFSGINGLESSIEAVRVVRHPRVGLGKGIAYVLFKTREAANLAVRKRNLKLRDRELRLSNTRQDSTPFKRKSSINGGINTPPSKKLAKDSTTASDPNNRSVSKGNMSYQGLRASKSSAQKKFRPKSNGPVKMQLSTQKEGTPKVRMTKRPSVAARKAKVQKEAGSSKYAGAKRKLDSRTPESSHRHKKVKKFR